jgi:nitroreductase/FMN reductase [NAD(P)H]
VTDENNLLQRSLTNRFGSVPYDVPQGNANLLRMANRSSCRRFDDRPVDDALIQTLCAVALASPTKSDLQQRDIVIVQDATLRKEINALFDNSSWINSAPVLLIFCGNNRRQRQLSEWRNKPFPNDHLDAFFNASIDAGIALSAFVTAAESVGLGCCPVSEIRNHCADVSKKLNLPQHVFPIAGLATGWPATPTSTDVQVSMRLLLSLTVHHNQFSESNVESLVDDYDERRTKRQPYKEQREPSSFGQATEYGWSEDKARQYTVPQRTDFGAYIRDRGFKLE